MVHPPYTFTVPIFYIFWQWIFSICALLYYSYISSSPIQEYLFIYDHTCLKFCKVFKLSYKICIYSSICLSRYLSSVKTKIFKCILYTYRTIVLSIYLECGPTWYIDMSCRYQTIYILHHMFIYFDPNIHMAIHLSGMEICQRKSANLDHGSADLDLANPNFFPSINTKNRKKID